MHTAVPSDGENEFERRRVQAESANNMLTGEKLSIAGPTSLQIATWVASPVSGASGPHEGFSV